MKTVLGVERWTISPETKEEFIIFVDYMERLPHVEATWNTLSTLQVVPRKIQDEMSDWAGMTDLPYLHLDFNVDPNLEQT